MDSRAFLGFLKSHPSYREQIAHLEALPAKSPRYGKLGYPLHPALEQALEELHLLPLYSHQAEAITAALQGENVEVVSGAASGKTLCYNAPILHTLLTQKRARALYLFPTKALAQDQLRGLTGLASRCLPGLFAALFDGDTPASERGEIKRRAQIVLSNPDMLHQGILPNHRSWAGFFRHLKYVVLDEVHTYRGVFGTHMAQVLNRLKRVCQHYGSRPQFIACSATVANPQEHIQNLVGLPFHIVAEDGAPRGAKEFVLWNPPAIDQGRQARRSPSGEATFLFGQLIAAGHRTLAFSRTRRLAELIYLYTRERLQKEGLEETARIAAYRGGYLPEERRRIEAGLFQGRLLGVSATNALELGVDIGDLEATIINGYPGTIASTWQQAWRSGRRGEPSLTFLVASGNPLDQYLAGHPEALFGKPWENAIVNPANPYILKAHLLCAAYELPLDAGDEALFGPSFKKLVEELVEEGWLRERGRRYFPTPALPYPAQTVNIRSTSADLYEVVDISQGYHLLETVEAETAFLQLYAGAIYLHQGESYLVKELDIEKKTAYVEPSDAPYYTQALELTDTRIRKVSKERSWGWGEVYLGPVEVNTRVAEFKKKAQFSDEVIGQEFLDLPPRLFSSVALWCDIPERAIKAIEDGGLDLAGGLHAAEHAMIGLLPLFAMCDRNDIGGVSTPLHPDTGRPQVFIYDAHPGGVGISEKGFELIEALWKATHEMLKGCPCEEGCPSCIQSPKCGNNNEPLDKKAAMIILGAFLGL